MTLNRDHALVTRVPLSAEITDIDVAIPLEIGMKGHPIDVLHAVNVLSEIHEQVDVVLLDFGIVGK